MAEHNHVSKVAIVGAGGNSGNYIVQSLLAAKNFTISALTRPGKSTTSLPEGVIAKPVDYDVFSTLVDALRGQDVLVITLNVMAPPDTQEKLVRAAGEAGVKWILPNAWAIDGTNEPIAHDLPLMAAQTKVRGLITEIGKSSYIALSTGFWYEWSLAIHDAFGFDFANKKVTLFDDGNSKIPISTWPHVGRAVASLLSLPISDPAKGPSLEKYRNSQEFVHSFHANQNVMFEPEGIGRMLYSRLMYADGSGDFLRYSTSINDDLRLPTEDIDDATRRAIKRSQEVDGWSQVNR